MFKTAAIDNRAAGQPFLQAMILAVLMTLFFVSAARADPIRIYLDADRTVNVESAISIEMGVRTAFAEVGNVVGGAKVEIVPLDHQGNVKKTLVHIRRYLRDDDALVMFGGLHSGPYIKYGKDINESGVLMLLPWSAAGPLTRTNSPENWVFRLSVDDTKAGGRMVEYALTVEECQRPILLLENTGWGRTNERTLTAALVDSGHPGVETVWFELGIGDLDARILTRSVMSHEADCVLMVTNAREGAALVNAIVQEEAGVKVFSHWGITGGDFDKKTSHEVREKANLRVLQTCFSFVRDKLPVKAQAVVSLAQSLFPGQFTDPRDLRAPVGFIHGYDLARILIAAIQEAGLTGDTVADRARIRNTLENLQTPVDGLIRTHSAPFRPYVVEDFDAHEALGRKDLCMAKYDADGRLHVFANPYESAGIR